jgi:hypothetical protein
MSGNVGDRLARLETAMEHVATREDIEKAKNAILRWLVGTIIVASGAVAAVVTAV